MSSSPAPEPTTKPTRRLRRRVQESDANASSSSSGSSPATTISPSFIHHLLYLGGLYRAFDYKTRMLEIHAQREKADTQRKAAEAETLKLQAELALCQTEMQNAKAQHELHLTELRARKNSVKGSDGASMEE